VPGDSLIAGQLFALLRTKLEDALSRRRRRRRRFSCVEITRRGDALSSRERTRQREEGVGAGGRGGAAASRKKGYRCLLAGVVAGRAGPGADERAARAGTSCCYLYRIRGHTGSVAEAERVRSLARAGAPREPGCRAVYQKATDGGGGGRRGRRGEAASGDGHGILGTRRSPFSLRRTERNEFRVLPGDAKSGKAWPPAVFMSRDL